MFVRESVSCRLTGKKKWFSSQSAVHQERKEGRGRTNQSGRKKKKSSYGAVQRMSKRQKTFYDFRDVLLDKLIPENE